MKRPLFRFRSKGDLKKRMLKPIRGFFQKGLTPVEVWFTVLLGTFLGLFPFVGFTSLLCAYAAHRFRLNHLLIQAVNYLVFPLQLALLIPFVRLGETVFGASERASYTLGQLLEAVGDKPMMMMGKFFGVTLYAVGAWSLTVLPLLVLLCVFFKRRLS